MAWTQCESIYCPIKINFVTTRISCNSHKAVAIIKIYICNSIISRPNYSLNALVFHSHSSISLNMYLPDICSYIPYFICFRIIWSICWLREFRLYLWHTKSASLTIRKRRMRNTQHRKLHSQAYSSIMCLPPITGWQTVPDNVRQQQLPLSQCLCLHFPHFQHTVDFRTHNRMFNFQLGFFDKINRNLIINQHIIYAVYVQNSNGNIGGDINNGRTNNNL